MARTPQRDTHSWIGSGFDSALISHKFDGGDKTPSLFTTLAPADFDKFNGDAVNIRPSASHLPETKLTDLERDKSIILDPHAGKQERLKAAQSMIESGQPEFAVKDQSGQVHNYHLRQSEKDGVKTVSITERTPEGERVLLAGIIERVLQQFARLSGQGELGPRAADMPAASGVSSDAGGFGSGSGRGAGRGGGAYVRVPRRPAGISGAGGDGGAATYREPSGTPYNPSGVDSRVWNGVKHADGSVSLSFKGCQVDTDGSGAWRHTEDRYRQNRTSLRMSNGQSLDTDRDSFFVLPQSVARAYGIKKGDLGWLVQKESGKAVPVVFGDVGPEGKLGEASVKALKDLGYTNVNGARGVSGDQFEVVFIPGSGNGTGDIASNTQAMADKLASLGSSSSQIV